MDALERLQEAGQVDNAFAGQQALIIVDLLRRDVRRVIEMDMDNAIAAGGKDVLGRGSRVVPVPGIEQQPDVGTTFFGERQHIVHAPDEFVFVHFAQFERTEKLEAEADVVARQNAGAFREPLLIGLAQFILWRIARRHDVGDHARAVDSGSELGGRVELGERGMEGCVVFAEFDRKIDDSRPDFESGKQVVGGAGAGLHGRAQHDVGPGKADFRGQPREVRPGNTTLQQDAVQGEEHIALGGESSGERG